MFKICQGIGGVYPKRPKYIFHPSVQCIEILTAGFPAVHVCKCLKQLLGNGCSVLLYLLNSVSQPKLSTV